jgi:methylmalonyl-CoA/ethylmalonyl-CoA epimerase
VVKGFHHVGIAVKDLENAIAFFQRTYGAKVVWRETYGDEHFETALVSLGHLRFELLSGLDSNSFVTKFVDSRGEGIHHISLEVDQFREVIADFRQKGLKLMAETDAKDFRAAFIHPGDNFGVLTEIIEPKGGWGK